MQSAAVQAILELKLRHHSICPGAPCLATCTYPVGTHLACRAAPQLAADRLAAKLIWVSTRRPQQLCQRLGNYSKLKARRPSRLHLAASKLQAGGSQRGSCSHLQACVKPWCRQEGHSRNPGLTLHLAAKLQELGDSSMLPPGLQCSSLIQLSGGVRLHCALPRHPPTG